MNHYQALGVTPDADREEIRAAYLRVMRHHHPDQRPGDAASGERARAANAAWEVLGNSARRAAYDRLRTARYAHRQTAPGWHTEHRADATVAYVAYSEEREQYRRVVTRSLLHFGVGAFVAGLVLLLVLA